MSDEPKKRSRAWIGWALFAVFVLYPLSYGPAYRWARTTEEDRRWQTVNTVYAPVDWLGNHVEWIGEALKWYIINLWQQPLDSA